jgi:hypothetical protein
MHMKENLREVQGSICLKCPDSPVSTKSSVSELTKKWQTTDEKLEDVWAHLQISSWKSRRLLSQERDVYVDSACHFAWQECVLHPRGTKTLEARTSLQQPCTDQIMTPRQLFSWTHQHARHELFLNLSS